MRCFILLVVGLPVLDLSDSREDSSNTISFSNEIYQQELNKKKWIVRVSNKKPIVSVVFYIITLTVGILYAVSTIWLVVENEIDPKIKNNLLKDSLLTILCLMWSSLTLFSISVLYNIFCR